MYTIFGTDSSIQEYAAWKNSIDIFINPGLALKSKLHQLIRTHAPSVPTVYQIMGNIEANQLVTRSHPTQHITQAPITQPITNHRYVMKKIGKLT